MTASQLIEGDGFQIALEQHSGYLRAHVFGGHDSLAVSIGIWRALTAQCQQAGVDRLLVIEDLDGTILPTEVEALTAAQIAMGLGRIRVAFVDLRGDEQNNELSGLSLREQDVQALVFGSEPEARAWLLYGID